jgi:hypothetical protein
VRLEGLGQLKNPIKPVHIVTERGNLTRPESTVIRITKIRIRIKLMEFTIIRIYGKEIPELNMASSNECCLEVCDCPTSNKRFCILREKC